MALQLALFSIAPPAVPAGPTLVSTPEVTAAELEAAGQLGIFEGPHRELRAVEAAAAALDPHALRAAAAAVRASYPRWPALAEWSAWAEGFEWLSGSDEQPVDPRSQCDRATALLDDETARGVFPGLPAGLLARVRIEAAARACESLCAEAGPLARLRDGRAAGTLPLRAGSAARALGPLRRAVDAGLVDGYTRSALADALRETGNAALALSVFRDALLRDPASVDEARLPSALAEVLDRAVEMDLRGEVLAWLPVLCDLEGILPLPAWLEDDPPFGIAGAFALELLRFRTARAAGKAKDALFAHKRKMNELCPALREQVRRLPV